MNSIFKLSLPIALDFLCLFLIFFTDTYFLAKISDNVAGSIGLLFAFFGLCAVVFRSIANSAVAICSRYLGANKNDTANNILYIAFFLNIILSIVFVMFVWLFAHQIGLWFGLDEINNKYTEIYLKIVGSSLIFLCLRYALSSFLLSYKNSLSNFTVTVLMLLINIFINMFSLFVDNEIYRLIIVCFGTLIAQLSACLYILFIVYKNDFDIKRLFSIPSNINAHIKEILQTTIPATFEPIIVQICNIIFALMVIKLSMQDASIRIYATNLSFILLSFSFGFAIGGQILVAHSFGAKQFSEIKQIYNKILTISFAFVIFIAVLFYFTSTNLFALFTNDVSLQNSGSSIFYLCLIVEIVKVLGLSALFALIGINEPFKPNVISALLIVFVSVPLSYVLMFQANLGLKGLFIAQIIEELLRGLILHFIFIKKLRSFHEI